MGELLSKVLSTTVGLAILTKEKAEELGKKIVDEAKLSSEDGKKVVDNIIQQSKETKDILNKYLSENFDKVISKMNLVRKEEVDELKKKIEELEQKLNK